MCGIAGVFYYRDSQKIPDPYLLRSMAEALAHRGPDGNGVYAEKGIGLAHSRLAVLDTTSAGNQPMSSLDGAIQITFSGEIYNFREIREELENKGYRFRSRTDTEVVINAYQEWGVESINKFSGIFAFGLWDEKKRLLWLARDHLGVKPLFYHDDGSRISFASEIKAILKDRTVPREINPDGLNAFFSFSYVPSPLTGFKHINQLLPGEWMVCTERDKKKKKYWKVDSGQQNYNVSLDEATEKLDSLLTKVVRRQMVSDVPLGGFLSGGLDSTAVVRAMKKSASKDFSVFTMGFKHSSFDEVHFAEKVASILDIKIIKECLNMDAICVLKEIAKYTEDPFADSSSLPLYVLCKLAKKHVTVALSGDGADELLAGYNTYRASNYAEFYRKIPRFLRANVIRSLASKIPVSDRKYSLHQTANRFINAAEEGKDRDHCYFRIIASETLKDSIYSSEYRNETKDRDPVRLYEQHIHAFPDASEKINRLLYADLNFYLPNDMLVKVDRMSMANGLEVRVPFLDTELVNFCANLPAEYKLHKGRITKYILRKILSKDMPESIVNRPKSGFNVPIEAWMREKKIADFFMDSLNSARKDASRYLDLSQIERSLRNHLKRTEDNAHFLFTTLMFFLWLENIQKF